MMTPPTGHTASAPRFERSLSLSLSDRRVVLGVLDLVLLNAALMAVAAGRLGEPWGWPALRGHAEWYLVLTGAWLLVAYLMDVYTARPGADLMQVLAATVTPAAALVAIYLAVPYLSPPLLHSRLTSAVFALSVIAALVVGRVGAAVVLSHPRFRRRVILVGHGPELRTIADTIRTRGTREHELLGVVTTNGLEAAEEPPATFLGTLANLPSLARVNHATEVILSVPSAARHGEIFEAVMACREMGIEVHAATDLYEQLTGRVPLQDLESDLRLVLSRGDIRPRIYESLKRFTDFMIGLCGLVILGALSLVIVPLVALDRGPVFIRQRRVGQGGRLLTLLKFRTMVSDAEDQGPQWAAQGDTRVTAIGRVLRRTHLDELPQALNLLRGDMSFVGPRPERPEFVEELAKILPYYRARHAVKPGITGWAQVNFPYGGSVEDALAKLEYDLYYIKHASLALDVHIVVRTVGLVLMVSGR